MATRLEQLKAGLDKVPAERKEYIISLVKDFCTLEEITDNLRKLPTFELYKDPNTGKVDPYTQRKLPAHDMLKEIQARKTDVARVILRELGGDVGDDNPLAEMLKEFKGRV